MQIFEQSLTVLLLGTRAIGMSGPTG